MTFQYVSNYYNCTNSNCDSCVFWCIYYKKNSYNCSKFHRVGIRFGSEFCGPDTTTDPKVQSWRCLGLINVLEQQPQSQMTFQTYACDAMSDCQEGCLFRVMPPTNFFLLLLAVFAYCFHVPRYKCIIIPMAGTCPCCCLSVPPQGSIE